MKASEFLGMVRDELAKGWTRGTQEDRDGNVCTIGSMRRVAEQNKQQTLDGFADLCRAGNGATVALNMLLKEFGETSIVSYNDSREHVQEVLDWCDKAVCQLEERGE